MTSGKEKPLRHKSKTMYSLLFENENISFTETKRDDDLLK